MTRVPTPREVAVEALREVWNTVPNAHVLLSDRDDRQKLLDVLEKLPAIPPTDEQMVSHLRGEGWTVYRTPPDAPDPADPAPLLGVVTPKRPTLRDPAAPPTSAASRGGKLLAVFAGAEENGLTSEEAMILAGMTATDGPWKRITELERSGLLEDVIGTNGEPVRRTAQAGNTQRVRRITTYGMSIAATFEEA